MTTLDSVNYTTYLEVLRDEIDKTEKLISENSEKEISLKRFNALLDDLSDALVKIENVNYQISVTI